MKIFSLIFIFICIVGYCHCKKQSKKMNSQAFAKQQTQYLSKIDVGEGKGFFKLIIKKDIGETNSDQPNIKFNIGILQDKNYAEFIATDSCSQKQQLYYDTREVFFIKTSRAEIILNVIQTQRQNFWYVYAYDCKSQPEMYTNLDFQTFTFELFMKNNGSWFGQNQNLIPQYLFVALLWLAITVKYSIPIYKSMQQTRQNKKFMVYIGFFFLILSYFYRLINLLLIKTDGRGANLLDSLADIIKHIVEGSLIGVMMSIAWGWSLITFQTDRISIFIGIFMTIFNIICSSIENQDTADSHYHYDKSIISIFIILRVLIVFFFLVGSRRTIFKSAGKIKLFMTKFSFWGMIYLLGWPVGFAICEYILPKQFRKQVMVLIQQSTHIIGNGFMCHSFAIATSEYKKVDKQNERILPD